VIPFRNEEDRYTETGGCYILKGKAKSGGGHQGSGPIFTTRGKEGVIRWRESLGEGKNRGEAFPGYKEQSLERSEGTTQGSFES